jgi:hypothetical protein
MKLRLFYEDAIRKIGHFLMGNLPKWIYLEKTKKETGTGVSYTGAGFSDRLRGAVPISRENTASKFSSTLGPVCSFASIRVRGRIGFINSPISLGSPCRLELEARALALGRPFLFELFKGVAVAS